MASTIVAPVAEALQAVIDGLAVTPPVKSYWPGGQRLVGKAPFGVIDVPRIVRTALDERETELGSDDWILSFPVVFYVDFSNAVRDQLRALEILEAFVDALDARPNLGAGIEDAKVVTGDPFIDEAAAAKPLFAYECEVQVFLRV